MNPKLTLVFAVLLAAALGVYFAYTPKPPVVSPHEDKVHGLVPERVGRIEVARAGEEGVALERVTEGQTSLWKIVGTADRAAEQDAVQKMLWCLDRFVKAAALEPSNPQAQPALTGLDKPRLSVTYRTSDSAETFRFGNSPATDTTSVYYQRQGDPAVYRAAIETFQSLDKTLPQLRSRQLLRLEHFRVVKMDLRRKYIKGEPGKPPRVMYEESTFEKLDTVADRGWTMTLPRKERVDQNQLPRLLGDLVGLAVEDYQPPGDPKIQGFDQPEAVMSFHLHGGSKPVTLVFGAATGDQKRRWVQVAGSGEVALMEAKRFDDFPTQRDDFRLKVIYPFVKDSVKTWTVEVRGDPKRVVIERKETKKPGDPVPTVKWSLLEPAGIKVDPESVERFVSNMMVQRITSFMGEQDLKLFRLDPPDVTVGVELTDGRKHFFEFGLNVRGYLRRDRVDEVFEVIPEKVELLRRLELNFMHDEVFNVPRENLRKFAVAWKGGGAIPDAYEIRLVDEKEKAWAFSDPKYKGKPVDAARLAGIVIGMEYIRAVAWVGRGEEALKKAGLLNEAMAAMVVTISWDGGPPEGTTLYIGQNRESEEHPLYHATMKDSGVVFQIPYNFVRNLKPAPVPRE